MSQFFTCTIFALCVPLPEPGAPRTKITVGFAAMVTTFGPVVLICGESQEKLSMLKLYSTICVVSFEPNL